MILALERDFYGAVAGDCFSGATTCGWPHLGANRGEKHFVPLHLHVLHKRSISLSWCTTGRATRSQDKTNDFLTLIFCGSGLSNTTSYCDAAAVEKQAKSEAMVSAFIVSTLTLKDGLVRGYSTSPQPCNPSHTHQKIWYVHASLYA